jgi:putative phosphoribosyl transferase
MLSMENRTVAIALPPHGREGLLGLPRPPLRGIVLFAHGSGGDRFSPREAHVAGALRQAGFATLLFDLLTNDEAADRSDGFDIALLAARLGEAANWVRDMAAGQPLPLGFFGAGTGAAAALVAAAGRIDVHAIVTRGGRSDLADNVSANVTAATLLIVGGNDPEGLTLNTAAHRRLRCLRQLEVVPGATHQFEEPGALQAAVALARDWFRRHMTLCVAEAPVAAQ